MYFLRIYVLSIPILSIWEREREREREKDRDSIMIVVGMYLNTSNLGLVWFGF